MNTIKFKHTFLFLATVFFSIAVTGIISAAFFQNHYIREQKDNLIELTHVVEYSLKDKSDGEFQGVVEEFAKSMGGSKKIRVTLVREDGSVAADSESDPAKMDNHGGRPEIIEAKSDGAGCSRRLSKTIKVEFLYCARGVVNIDGAGFFIRVAEPSEFIDKTVGHIRDTVFFAALATAIMGFFVSWTISAGFARPLGQLKDTAGKIAAGDLAARSRISGADEFASLGHSIDDMAENLEKSFVDINRKKSEVENILKSIRDGIIVVDSEKRVLLHNESVFGLLGIERGNIMNKPFINAIRNKAINDGLARAIDRGETVDMEIVTHPIAKTTINARIFPFINHSGEISGAITTIRDVTSVKNLERARTEFIENASHELRTPVALIKGFVETLLGGAMDDPAAASRFLSMLGKESDRLSNLADDILALERAEKKASGEKADPIDISAQVAELARQFFSRGEAKGLTINSDFCAEPLYVSIPPEDFMLVFNNLMDNAIKFTDSGAVSVSLKLESGMAELVVADTGDGIPPADAERIFERFYRVDKSRSRQKGGTGLGLSIAKHIVERWGGSIKVASAPGKGSAFTVRLPIN